MKRGILHYMLIFFAVYSIAYIVEYNNSKQGVECEINELFKESAPYFHDSIFKAANHFHSYVYKPGQVRKPDMTLASDRGELKISYDLINIENPLELLYRKRQTAMLLALFEGVTQCYNDLFIADSVWNRQLREHGYDAEAILLVSVKDFYEMFPRRDSLATNLRAQIYSVHNLSGKDYFVTDSVRLGICDQGYISSHVHVPVLTVLGHTKWYGTPLFVAIIVLLLLVAVAVLRQYFAERKSAAHYKDIAESMDDEQIIEFGNFVYNVVDCTLYNTVSRQQLKLPRIQAQIMKMLVTSENYYVAKNEICKEVWETDEKQATRSYNSACKRLRDSLECIDGIRLSTIKDTAIQLEFVE